MNKRLLWVGAGVIVLGVLLGLFFMLNKSPSLSIDGGTAQELYASAVSAEEKNDLREAKANFQKIIAEAPDFKDIAKVQKELEAVNLRIIFSATETPKTTIYEIQSGDSLAKIAKKYNTTVELLKKSNNLLSDTIRVGERLRIWTGVFSVYADKSQNILTLKSDDEIVKTYIVSTGKNNCTPVGAFKIVDKLVNPVWFKSGAIVPPDSPENILGSRWMGIDVPGYGIHGTTEPESLGQQVTAGCIRMRNPDVEELFSILPVGTQVTIVD